MKKTIYGAFAVAMLLQMASLKTNAQATNTFPATGSAGVGTTTPVASALLEMVSTTKGFLPPRMTKAQRDAIVAPATGLVVYQTNMQPGLYFYSGAAWTAVTSAGGANKTLSNLQPTSINQNLTPSGDKLRDLGSKTIRWDEVYAANVIATDNDQLIPVGSFINTRVDTTVDVIALNAFADTAAFDPGTAGAPWGIGVNASGGFIGALGVGYGIGGNGLYGIGDIGVLGEAFDTTFLAGWGLYSVGHVVATGSYWSFSDRKFKTNIKTMEGSLDKIMKLNPTTYNYKTDEFANMKLAGGLQDGLIADELEEIFPEMVRVSKTPIRRDPVTGERIESVEFKSVNYQALIPVLISAMQEQQTEIEAKNAEIEELNERIRNIETSLNEFAATGKVSTLAPAAYLVQNAPNPFKEKSVISFYIPETVANAVIKVYSLNGEEMKSITVNTRGNSNVEILGGSFQAGTYTYQLVLDGKAIDTKLMVITK